jgi:hypothetical protein
MRRLTEERRLDVVRDVLDGLALLLDDDTGRIALRVGSTRAALREVLAVVPPDLAAKVAVRLEER